MGKRPSSGTFPTLPSFPPTTIISHINRISVPLATTLSSNRLLKDHLALVGGIEQVLSQDAGCHSLIVPFIPFAPINDVSDVTPQSNDSLGVSTAT